MKRLIWTTGILALTALAACASKDDDAEPSQQTDAGDGVVPYQPEGNGARTSEAEACERMVTALDDRASDLGCVITYPPCPQYLRQSTSGACYEYDEGTIDSCVDFIGKYQTCEDFQRRPCIVTYFGDSTCEDESDAGTDAADEEDADTESDAGEDADTET